MLAYNPVGSYLANDADKKLPMPWPFSARARSLTPALGFLVFMRKEQAINNGALVLRPPPALCGASPPSSPSLLNSSIFSPPYVIKRGLDLVLPFRLKFIGQTASIAAN